MYKMTETYTDYNGVERTEDFYFHFTKAEIAELEFGVDGGLSNMLETIVKAHNMPTIIKTFKEIVLKAYGEKSADGRCFIKNDDLRNAFAQTEAYSNIFMKLATDEQEAIKFVNNVVPHDKNITPEQIAAHAKK